MAKLGERYIKLNALKKLVNNSKHMSLTLIDHTIEGVFVIIKDSTNYIMMTLPDTDKPTTDDAEAYIKGKIDEKTR